MNLGVKIDLTNMELEIVDDNIINDTIMRKCKQTSIVPNTLIF